MRNLPAAILLLLAACAGPQPFVCTSAQQSAAIAELYFGRNVGRRLGVSESAWRNFLATEISPRFPEGLTVINAAGQWRDAARNTLVHEPSKIVSIVLRDPARDEALVDAVVEAYKRRFHQQSVGVVIRPACVQFR